uniref:Uncharacterized protein n=1 Tax=Romanomermis culicivorax TaxID=13658 RepID=A0A915IWQ2_ROMCU
MNGRKSITRYYAKKLVSVKAHGFQTWPIYWSPGRDDYGQPDINQCCELGHHQGITLTRDYDSPTGRFNFLLTKTSTSVAKLFDKVAQEKSRLIEPVARGSKYKIGSPIFTNFWQFTLTLYNLGISYLFVYGIF